MSVLLRSKLPMLPGADPGWLSVYDSFLSEVQTFESRITINREIRRLLATYPRSVQIQHPYQKSPPPPPPISIDREVGEAIANYWKCTTANDVELLILSWALARM